MENKEPMFKTGQKLEVTDNTNKPYNQVQRIKILSLMEIHPTYGPEYEVFIENPDEDEILEYGMDAHTSIWALDKAIEENRIFVKELKREA